MSECSVLKLVGADLKEVKKSIEQLPKGKEIKATISSAPCEVTIRLQADDKKILKAADKNLKESFSEFIFSVNEEETLEDVLVKSLTKKELIITTAESCTGGLLAGRIVNANGASSVFNQGFITYSNKAKRKQIGVSKDTLKKYGAVSKQTAKEMAKGVALVADADVALSVTGIAGPEGGTKEKPVGLVYIGCYYNGKTTVEEHQFKGNRSEVRAQSVASALNLLRKCIS